MIHFKVEVDDKKFRRFSLSDDASFKTLMSKVGCLCGKTTFDLCYVDDEDDLIILDTEEEFKDLLENTSYNKDVVRLVIRDKAPTRTVDDCKGVVSAQTSEVRPSNPYVLLSQVFRLLAPVYTPGARADLLAALSAAITSAIVSPALCEYDVAEVIGVCSGHSDAILTAIACDRDYCDTIGELCKEFVTATHAGRPQALSRLLEGVMAILKVAVPQPAILGLGPRTVPCPPAVGATAPQASHPQGAVGLCQRDLQDSGPDDDLSAAAAVPLLTSVYSDHPLPQDDEPAPEPEPASAPVCIPTWRRSPADPSPAEPATPPPASGPVAVAAASPRPAVSAPSPPVSTAPATATATASSTNALTANVTNPELLLLKELAEMGFEDVARNRALLRIYENDITQVVNRLLEM